MSRRRSQMERLTAQLSSLKAELRPGSKLVRKKEYVMPTISPKMRGEFWVRTEFQRPVAPNAWTFTTGNIFTSLGLTSTLDCVRVIRIRAMNNAKPVSQPATPVVNTGSATITVTVDESPSITGGTSSTYSAQGDEGISPAIVEVELGHAWKMFWINSASNATSIFSIGQALQGNTPSSSVIVDLLVEVIIRIPKATPGLNDVVEPPKKLEVYGIRCNGCVGGLIVQTPSPGLKTGNGLFVDGGAYICTSCGPDFDGEPQACTWSNFQSSAGQVSLCDTFGPHTRCFQRRVESSVSAGFEVVSTADNN
jgi:hypothetical protein